MLLDALKSFSWYNEPENVRFIENGMQIATTPETDFWQNSAYHLHRDNGHFFYTSKTNDFNLTVKWSFSDAVASDQCGLMLRIDNLNWAKISLLSADMRNLQIGTVVTNNGYSDWSGYSLRMLPSELWFKIVRRGNDFALSFSEDGSRFERVRTFSIPLALPSVKVGGYACSPQKRSFICVLEDIY